MLYFHCMDILAVDNIEPREVSVVGMAANEYTEILNVDTVKRKIYGIASVEVVDDYSTLLSIKSMNLNRFTQVYFEHGLSDATKIPIGRIEHAQKTVRDGKNAVLVHLDIAKTEPQNRLADIVLNKVDKGYLKGLSIGFPPLDTLEFSEITREEAENYDSYQKDKESGNMPV